MQYRYRGGLRNILMKKSIIFGAFLALCAFSAFAEPITKESIKSNVEKFLNGKGSYISSSFTVENNDIVLYIPREKVKNLELREPKGVGLLFINADVQFYDQRISAIGFGNIQKDEWDSHSLAVKANDISVDANGNLIIKKQ